ncbi:hypothetical protein LAW_30082 (plasmid) [Lawsonia intracellularis N343]|nr:hypothetical protein LAW_30082 [Lawsonia intracellularis N343]
MKKGRGTMHCNVKFVNKVCSARRWFSICVILTVLLFLALVIFSPRQLPVIHYKFALCLLAGLAGYWLDRVLFPFANPSGYLCEDWKEHINGCQTGRADYPIVIEYQKSFCTAMLRQAAIVVGTMLAVSLGL